MQVVSNKKEIIFKNEYERIKEENEKLKRFNKYTDEGYQEIIVELEQKINKAIEILHNLNDTLPLDLILSEIEHSENILQNGNKDE